MKWFSKRSGYIKPSDVIIREQLTKDIQNAICSAFDVLPNLFTKAGAIYGEYDYIDVERFLWTPKQEHMRPRQRKRCSCWCLVAHLLII